MGRILVMNLLTVVRDRAFCDVTVVNVEQAGDGAQRGCLARTVCTEQGNDLSFAYFEAEPTEYENNIVVDDFEIRYFKHVPIRSSRFGRVGERLSRTPTVSSVTAGNTLR